MKVFVERMGINGEGIAIIPDGKDKGKLIFIDGAIEGEVVDIDIVSDRGQFFVAKLNNIKTMSQDRVKPKCKYFGVCGGCDLQHMNAIKQSKIKIDGVLQTLKRIANIDDINCEIVSLNKWNYRNKMVFPFSYVNNNLVIGMNSKKSHDVVNIDNCLIADDNINKILSISKNYFNTLKDDKVLTNLKYLVVRSIDNQNLVTIVSKKKIDISNYYIYLKNNFEKIGLSLIVSDNKKDILSGKYYYIDGLEKISVNENGINYSFNNLGFIQVNSEIKESLYQEVLNNIEKGDIVIDGYGGAGLLAGIISRNCKKVKTVEINKSASLSAKNLAIENNIKNIEVYNDDFANVLSDIIEPSSVLLLDPPRSGCDKSVIDTVNNNIDSIKKIIYISCNPSTLARDLKMLKGYFVKNIKLYDMFPQTKHVETLVVLERT
ncbi:MAG: 23S rRNA (uracil(1939)-C(5))-methyltransferase RlmD [Clostridiales bacterium]|nr:23S rRNA (uracil(1939)-C(5))-methyltransferase RlmD [Clostridiales bacterium]